MKSAVKSVTRFTLLASGLALLGACQSAPSNSPNPAPKASATSASAQARRSQPASPAADPATASAVRRAYENYLDNAELDEKSRFDALSRLAQLEIEQSAQAAGSESAGSAQELAASRKLQRTIQLLETATQDFPDAIENETLLYQLAKAYAQNDQYQQSIDALQRLSEKFANSPFYAEAQFRIAEDAFSRTDYSAAEYAYSEVLVAPDNTTFYEKALFKRGWARFKQNYYDEGVEDFISAIQEHRFAGLNKMSTEEKELFDEYYRSVTLALTYQEDSSLLKTQLAALNDPELIHQAYHRISELFLKQERYSDAAQTQQQFIKDHPKSDYLPYAYLQLIEIWKLSGFTRKLYQAVEEFYAVYNPSSRYWKDQQETVGINRRIRRALREYVALLASYYHEQYQAKPNAKHYQRADKWYRRYLKHYDAYAREDKVYYRYAGLLAQNNKKDDALGFYEKAALDNEIILNKDAAYAAIQLSAELYGATKKPSYFEHELDYALYFARQFADDPRSLKLTTHAAELAFRHKRYTRCIELIDQINPPHGKQATTYTDSLQAASYFELSEFAAAETIFGRILKRPNLKAAQRKEFSDKLALTIYRQGEQSKQQQDFSRAIHHFARIVEQAPRSSTAATGLYDAIALNIQHKQWQSAIGQIKTFQQRFPRHKRSADVSKKLSLAYLKSDQGVKAAQEFEKISKLDSDQEVRAAALWQAAELYEQKNKLNEAIKTYKKYADSFKKPYTQRLEAMYKVAQLYQRQDNSKQNLKWLNTVVRVDRKILGNQKTDRSRRINADANLALARYEMARFGGIKLVAPLKTNLEKKRKAMQGATHFFAKASVDKIYEIATESTYSIGRIYKDFSKALLESERPKNLNDEELEQYEILLEDQAFPFEDKAIEFLEINLARIKDGQFNQWIGKSHDELKTLFPVRYAREPKVDDYIEDIY